MSGLLNIEDVLVLMLTTFLSDCYLSGFLIGAFESAYLYYFLDIKLTFYVIFFFWEASLDFGLDLLLICLYEAERDLLPFSLDFFD